MGSAFARRRATGERETCWCSISIHLSSRSVTFSAGHVAFLCMCLPGLSLPVSALFRWPCSISIHLSPRSALLVSALFCWRCNISIHLSPRCVTAGVRPFPLAMCRFYSFVSQVCRCWCLPFSAGHVACLFSRSVRPFPLAMQRFYSFVCEVCHCWCPLFSAGDATFLFHSPHSSPLRRVSQFFLKMFFPQIAGSYRGSYFSMDGFRIAEIGCRCRLVSQACLPS